MSEVKYFSDKVLIAKKTVLLRLDFNVPIINGKIQDASRIDLTIPLIKKLLQKKAKVIIFSHLGRPKNNNEKKFSLLPIFNYLNNKITNKIYFYTDKIDIETKKKISLIKDAEIILFENIRFNEGEEKNDDKFAKILSSLGEIYINDAFSSSHRKQASIHKITNFLKECYGGPLLNKELNAINMVLRNKKSPVTCIVGGSKVSTKIGIINSLIEKVDNLVITGAMANNFLAFKGNKIGKSLVENGSEKIIKDIDQKSSRHKCRIIIPEDCSVGKEIDGDFTFKNLSDISDDDIILDIGPKTINTISSIIDNSKTVLWNGPAGYFENKNFSNGTTSIAKKISENTSNNLLLSIIGGGDTISAINLYSPKLKFTHLSTAGGAFLEFLEGKSLPGIEVLK